LVVKIVAGIAIEAKIVALRPGMNGKVRSGDDNDAGHAQVVGHLAPPDKRPLHDVHADHPGNILQGPVNVIQVAKGRLARYVVGVNYQVLSHSYIPLKPYIES
jgi:hypothetical protein